MKKHTLFLISCLFFLIQEDRAQIQEQNNNPIKGVGVVVKKNPGSGACKLLATNENGETGVKILNKSNYKVILNSSSGSKRRVNNKDLFSVGICNNERGIIEKYYTPDNNGEIELKNLSPGTYYLKIIKKITNACPTGYVTRDGVCSLQTTTVNGKLVFISCVNGKMQYNEVVCDEWNCCHAGETVISTQTGDYCTGEWVHLTNIKAIRTTVYSDDENGGTSNSGPVISRTSFFANVRYTTFTPEIKVPGLGNIVDKPASGIELSFEMALPNKTGRKRKLIPAIELGANYSKFSFNNGLSLMQQKYPPLSASESRMVNASKENKKGRIISVSIVPKFIVPIWRFNVSLGAGITYLNHTIPDVNVQDELVKTNNNQPLEYATSICCNHRVKFGGEFRMNLSYWLTNSIAVTGGAGYMAGPKNNAELNLLKATDSNSDKLFSVGELRNGTMQQAAYTYSLNAVKLNAGVIIALQRKHDYVGHVTLLR